METNRLVVGILAHVDAGKTTLAENMLYTTGKIRNMGRVDHGDAFLDHYELERSRGITIFSKQAEMGLPSKSITLLDTPGHVDFSAEMERTLQVLDYAILVISGMDGVQGHVETLWQLLKIHRIPVLLFINKMDQDGTDKAQILKELQKKLDEHCVDFSGEQRDEKFYESLALADEGLLETFLDGKAISEADIRRVIAQRKIFPCYFGSALHSFGVEAFLDGLDTLTVCPDYPEEFGARVYKISRDASGTRLTYIKVTGGSLKVKSQLKGEEKIDQIRIYSGSSYVTANEVTAGTVCAVTGLSDTRSGEGLGVETEDISPILIPVLTYQILFPEATDIHSMYGKLKQLEEEEPELHMVWDKEHEQIHVQVMGDVQLEILESLIAERYHEEVSFGAGSIVYKETIADTVMGCGHYEPLRHYAEVRLLLEPGERGSGIVLDSDCPEDVLDRNWQRLILTHLAEKAHKGVLTGSEITDIKITLLTGRAHLKHTEGGDFRQATYRAVRQGLKKAESILLEPVYEYRLEVPAEMIGRAMADVQRMKGTFQPPIQEEGVAVLTGRAPIATMRHYQKEVAAYTKGRGRLFCTFAGYDVCHNREEIIAQTGYDSEQDLDNPTGSVFCAHGAGFTVPWNEVDEHMHTTNPLRETKEATEAPVTNFYEMPPVIDEEELKEIFARTYHTGKQERKTYATRRVEAQSKGISPGKPKYDGPEYLLVDGYNIIYAWDDLKELAGVDLCAARDKLMDILCNYQGYKKNVLILVFDAYKVPGNSTISKYHNIYVVYTKEAETADQYIEKTVHAMGRRYHVTVATSDAIEQVIIMGQGAHRISARGLLEEIELMNREIRETYLEKEKETKTFLSELIDEVKNGNA